MKGDANAVIYFTTDLHFYHANMIPIKQRPFADVEEMNRAPIANWNRRVGREDEVYILGDVTLKGPALAEEALRQLAEKKYLIRGNHDRFVDKAGFDQSLFVWIKDYYVLHWQGKRFVLFHYPIEEWDQYFRRAYHLRGHQHNDPEHNQAHRSIRMRRYDVGVDANGFAPVSIEEIVTFFQEAP